MTHLPVAALAQAAIYKSDSHPTVPQVGISESEAGVAKSPSSASSGSRPWTVALIYVLGFGSLIGLIVWAAS